MNDELFSLLAALDGIPQSPKYHPEGDALYHSLQVFELALEATDDPVLWAAALFHDVGKAIDGPLHDEVGADLLEGLMYGEEVKQYFTAKRLAARRLLGRVEGRTTRFRPHDLPSNGEIKQALLELVTEIEGDGRTQRLFAMRVVALEALEALSAFHPRLIGSVATGHVRSGSDIDVHVFAWDAADVESRARELDWTYETQRVSILKHGKVMSFTHILVEDIFPIELTVYAPNELAHRPRSSTDGKPIVRIRDSSLRKICEDEHGELWRRYLEDGSTPTMEDILAAEDADDPAFQQLLEEQDPFDEDAIDPRLLVEAPAEVDDDDYVEAEREPRLRRPRDTSRVKRRDGR